MQNIEMKSRKLALLTLAVMIGGCGASAAGAPPAAPAPVAVGGADMTRFTRADVEFMSAMIGHHAQAITMSRMAPTHGASPSIQILAARIINAQEDEIKLMQQWLRDRNQPVPEASADASAHHHGAHESMPGMLTAAQLQELDAARGKAFDELFLKDMIQHHRGAIAMVDALVATAGAAQHDATFKIVSDINVDQATEIERMQKMLFDLLIGKEAP
jgi:uncharacterized protein (DUF305 family)